MNLRLLFILIVLSGGSLFAQDTFSIVAVDTVTGQLGSAGASCIDATAIAGGAKIISDILPGRGAIHTQSYWLSANQVNARNRMLAGDSPQQIIDWLVANDVQNQPGRRQYGIVDMDENGNPRSAAYTGATSMNWKGHITGRNYAIQGNILLSQAIIDSMEARFNATEGMLSDKLMAALQGANVPGADSRCLNEGVSSLSAFIRVANSNDVAGNFFLDLNVPQTPYGVEPIDSLQVLYDEWKMILGLDPSSKTDNDGWLIYPNPTDGLLHYSINSATKEAIEMLFTATDGKTLLRFPLSQNTGSIDVSNLPKGNLMVRLIWNDGKSSTKKLLLK
ncbi:MAG: DUF1028 domain-containing protein [Bacteroidales bacterium]|nr:DUF1028 domain-containing protein [Bacteroidales bacterium]